MLAVFARDKLIPDRQLEDIHGVSVQDAKANFDRMDLDRHQVLYRHSIKEQRQEAPTKQSQGEVSVGMWPVRFQGGIDKTSHLVNNDFPILIIKFDIVNKGCGYANKGSGAYLSFDMTFYTSKTAFEKFKVQNQRLEIALSRALDEHLPRKLEKFFELDEGVALRALMTVLYFAKTKLFTKDHTHNGQRAGPSSTKAMSVALFAIHFFSNFPKDFADKAMSVIHRQVHHQEQTKQMKVTEEHLVQLLVHWVLLFGRIHFARPGPVSKFWPAVSEHLGLRFWTHYTLHTCDLNEEGSMRFQRNPFKRHAAARFLSSENNEIKGHFIYRLEEERKKYSGRRDFDFFTQAFRRSEWRLQATNKIYEFQGEQVTNDIFNVMFQSLLHQHPNWQAFQHCSSACQIEFLQFYQQLGNFRIAFEKMEGGQRSHTSLGRKARRHRNKQKYQGANTGDLCLKCNRTAKQNPKFKQLCGSCFNKIQVGSASAHKAAALKSPSSVNVAEPETKSTTSDDNNQPPKRSKKEDEVVSASSSSRSQSPSSEPAQVSRSVTPTPERPSEHRLPQSKPDSSSSERVDPDPKTESRDTTAAESTSNGNEPEQSHIKSASPNDNRSVSNRSNKQAEDHSAESGLTPNSVTQPETKSICPADNQGAPNQTTGSKTAEESANEKQRCHPTYGQPPAPNNAATFEPFHRKFRQSTLFKTHRGKCTKSSPFKTHREKCRMPRQHRSVPIVNSSKTPSTPRPQDVDDTPAGENGSKQKRRTRSNSSTGQPDEEVRFEQYDRAAPTKSAQEVRVSNKLKSESLKTAESTKHKPKEHLSDHTSAAESTTALSLTIKPEPASLPKLDILPLAENIVAAILKLGSLEIPQESEEIDVIFLLDNFRIINQNLNMLQSHETKVTTEPRVEVDQNVNNHGHVYLRTLRDAWSKQSQMKSDDMLVFCKRLVSHVGILLKQGVGEHEQPSSKHANDLTQVCQFFEATCRWLMGLEGFMTPLRRHPGGDLSQASQPDVFHILAAQVVPKDFQLMWAKQTVDVMVRFLQSDPKSTIANTVAPVYHLVLDTIQMDEISGNIFSSTDLIQFASKEFDNQPPEMLAEIGANAKRLGTTYKELVQTQFQRSGKLAEMKKKYRKRKKNVRDLEAEIAAGTKTIHYLAVGINIFFALDKSKAPSSPALKLIKQAKDIASSLARYLAIGSMEAISYVVFVDNKNIHNEFVIRKLSEMNASFRQVRSFHQKSFYQTKASVGGDVHLLGLRKAWRKTFQGAPDFCRVRDGTFAKRLLFWDFDQHQTDPFREHIRWMADTFELNRNAAPATHAAQPNAKNTFTFDDFIKITEKQFESAKTLTPADRLARPVIVALVKLGARPPEDTKKGHYQDFEELNDALLSMASGCRKLQKAQEEPSVCFKALVNMWAVCPENVKAHKQTLVQHQISLLTTLVPKAQGRIKKTKRSRRRTKMLKAMEKEPMRKRVEARHRKALESIMSLPGFWPSPHRYLRDTSSTWQPHILHSFACNVFPESWARVTASVYIRFYFDKTIQGIDHAAEFDFKTVSWFKLDTLRKHTASLFEGGNDLKGGLSILVSQQFNEQLSKCSPEDQNKVAWAARRLQFQLKIFSDAMAISSYPFKPKNSNNHVAITFTIRQHTLLFEVLSMQKAIKTQDGKAQAELLELFVAFVVPRLFFPSL